jgi:diadenosine tetraphosphatase ApaH/serine/threonine PP2A family protein phosphatase
MLTLDGKRFLMVHATPRDPLDEYVPADPAAWAARIAGLKVDFVLAGHTHVPFKLQIGQTTVLNPGAIGLQRDGDPRARYAVIDNGKVEMKQVEYDVEATVSAIMANGLDPLAKRMLADVYRVGRYVHPADMPTPLATRMPMVNGGGKSAKPVTTL